MKRAMFLIASLLSLTSCYKENTSSSEDPRSILNANGVTVLSYKNDCEEFRRLSIYKSFKTIEEISWVPHFKGRYVVVFDMNKDNDIPKDVLNGVENFFDSTSYIWTLFYGPEKNFSVLKETKFDNGTLFNGEGGKTTNSEKAWIVCWSNRGVPGYFKIDVEEAKKDENGAPVKMEKQMLQVAAKNIEKVLFKERNVIL